MAIVTVNTGTGTVSGVSSTNLPTDSSTNFPSISTNYPPFYSTNATGTNATFSSTTNGFSPASTNFFLGPGVVTTNNPFGATTNNLLVSTNNTTSAIAQVTADVTNLNLAASNNTGSVTSTPVSTFTNLQAEAAAVTGTPPITVTGTPPNLVTGTPPTSATGTVSNAGNVISIGSTDAVGGVIEIPVPPGAGINATGQLVNTGIVFSATGNVQSVTGTVNDVSGPVAPPASVETPRKYRTLDNLFLDPNNPSLGFSRTGFNSINELSLQPESNARVVQELYNLDTSNFSPSELNRIAESVGPLYGAQSEINSILSQGYRVQRYGTDLTVGERVGRFFGAGAPPTQDNSIVYSSGPDAGNLAPTDIQDRYRAATTNFKTAYESGLSTIRSIQGGRKPGETATGVNYANIGKEIFGATGWDTLTRGTQSQVETSLGELLNPEKVKIYRDEVADSVTTYSPEQIQKYRDLNGTPLNPNDPAFRELRNKTVYDTSSASFVESESSFVDEFFTKTKLNRTPELEDGVRSTFRAQVAGRNVGASLAERITFDDRTYTERTSRVSELKESSLGSVNASLSAFETQAQEVYNRASGNEQIETRNRLQSEYNLKKKALDNQVKIAEREYVRTGNENALNDRLSELSDEYQALEINQRTSLSDAQRADYNVSYWSRYSWDNKRSTNWQENVLPALAMGSASLLPLLTTFWLNPKQTDKAFERQKELMELQYQYYLKGLSAQGGGGGGGGGGGRGGTPTGNTGVQLARY